MELTSRIKYLTFILLGVLFLITGFALNELDILGQIDPSNFDEWYDFLAPWVGNPENGGIPVPWDQ